ncbi:Gabbr1, partial [Symbiodinium microadriaticum]
MNLFEANLDILADGNAPLRRLANGRSLAMTDIPQTDSFLGDSLNREARSVWSSSAKPIVEAFISAATATDQDLKTAVEALDAAMDASLDAANYFSTTTRTTTMLTLEILTPLPLTGAWAGGQTFRTAARLAEGIINEDQLILPGYQLHHDIFDDKCDPSVGSDVVVSANSEKDSYVAIGGMGCDTVCRQVSSLAVSMRLPFLSYGCASADFTDTAAFP